jgi:nitrate/nitrite transporter NarK
MGDKADVTAMSAKMEQMEKEIGQLHDLLSAKGMNSRGTTDIYGRKFSVPVDQEHKATALVIFNADLPHNRAFHTSWFGFFSSFFSMFAAAPMIMYIRKPSSLGLTKPQIGTANISAVSTNIVMRATTGFLCDILGPRRALAFLLFVTCPAILGMQWVNNADGFIACRAMIGIALATFVTSQVWCSQMFNKSIVGLANATSAGWGNLGGGVTNLLMPFIFDAMYANGKDPDPLVNEDRAWRNAYLVPLAMHFVGGCAALTGRDLPDGNIKELEASGAKQKSKGGVVLKTGLSNVNAWVFVLTYGMCFGVELTMNSVAAAYFHDYHGQSVRVAGLLASIYGLMNLFARSLGGLLSDAANKKYGMRGRLWACWIVQTIEGVFCILMATITLDMDAPFNRGKVPAWTKMTLSRAQRALYPDYVDGWVPVNTTFNETMMIEECSALEQAPPAYFQEYYDVGTDKRLFLEPPFSRDGDAAKCISNQGASGQVVLFMILFSLCVQAAEGLHYGIVPYVSRPALGIVSGMVGAGGNLGSVIALWSFFKGGDIRTDHGFLYLGIMVISITALMFFVYFPDMGSMLTPAKALGSYYPQLIKPPADYRGADSIDFAAIKKDNEAKSSTTEGVAVQA